MKNVVHLNIVVASPADVAKERQLVEKVAAELNEGLARDRGLRLDVVRWETDAYPGFHPEGPQGLIDPILAIEDSDVLIGIFWKRFGTPVSDAASGTEHEFLKAYASWQKTGQPQILFYFNQEPYSALSAEESRQRTQVLEFKERFPKEGLSADYKGSKSFEAKVRSHLQNYIRAQFPAAAASSAAESKTSVSYFVNRLSGPEAVYGALCEYLNQYRYFFNTVFSTAEGIFPLDPFRARYYDLKLRRVAKERLKCKELYSGGASSLYEQQISTLLKEAGSRVIRLPARFDVRRIDIPNLSSLIGFCVFLKSETDLNDGVLMLGWLLNEENVCEDQECLATNHPELVELYARHFLALYNKAERHPWPK